MKSNNDVREAAETTIADDLSAFVGMGGGMAGWNIHAGATRSPAVPAGTNRLTGWSALRASLLVGAN